MKSKVIFALLIAAVPVFFAGCQKGLAESPENKGGLDTDGLIVTIDRNGCDTGNGFGSGDETLTKTMLSSNGYICWSEGDKIWVNGSATANTLTVMLMDRESTEAMVDKTVDPNTSGRRYVGYYPANASYWDTGTREVKLPSTRAYSAANPVGCVPMYAESDSRYLTFKSPFAIMELVFKGRKKINSIKLTSTAGNLSGTFAVNSTGTAEFVSAGTATPNEVTINISGGIVPGDGEGAKVYVALAAGTYNNLRVEVNTDETNTWGGLYAKSVSSITVRKGVVYSNAFDTDAWEGVLMWYPAADAKGLYWSKFNVGATNGTTLASWFGDYYCWGAVTKIYSSISIPAAGVGTIVMSPSVPESITGKYPLYLANYTSGTVNYGTCPYANTTSPTATSGWNKYGSDGKRVLEPVDDVAHCVLGGNWRMPTGGSATSESHKLYTSCGGTSGGSSYVSGNIEWRPNEPITGMCSVWLKSQTTGKELIFPAGGVFRLLQNQFYYSTTETSIYGMYFTSTMVAGDYRNAYRIRLNKEYAYFGWSSSTGQTTGRYDCCTIRPVQEL